MRPVTGKRAVLLSAAALVFATVIGCDGQASNSARDHMKRVEAAVALPRDQRIDTTANLGGRPRRLLSVNRVVYLLLASVAVADLDGVLLIAFRD
jgi:hypothetical protein